MNENVNKTVLDAAKLISSIKDNETAIVEAFRDLPQQERDQLARAFGMVSTVLLDARVFRPILFEKPIKILISSYEQGIAVQKALFKLGCGYHMGNFPLAPSLLEISLSAILVGRRGMMTVATFSAADKAYLAQNTTQEIAAESVLSATSTKELEQAYLHASTESLTRSKMKPRGG